jgi:serine/threonine-protein phosphatase PGAM5
MRFLRLATLALALLTVTIAGAAEPPARTSRTIILVRHGHYIPDSADSTPGPGLSPLGIAQAKLVAARLSSMHFDAVYASPMTRAAETAKIIAADLPGAKIETVKDLEECTPRTRREEIIAREKPEDMTACAQRLDALFGEKFVPSIGPAQRDLIVAHGNVIRYLVTRALGVDTAAWLEMSVAHASMTTILIEADGRFKLIALGDSGHIPPNLLTGATGMLEKALAVPK